MASTPRPRPRRRLRLAVAGAAVLTALTAATAAAATLAPMGEQAAGPSRQVAGSAPAPEDVGYVLERGQARTVAFPGATRTVAAGINDRVSQPTVAQWIRLRCTSSADLKGSDGPCDACNGEGKDHQPLADHAKNSFSAGASAVSSTLWPCPSNIRASPRGSASASARAVSRIHGMSAPPASTSVGTRTDSARPVGSA